VGGKAEADLHTKLIDRLSPPKIARKTLVFKAFTIPRGNRLHSPRRMAQLITPLSSQKSSFLIIAYLLLVSAKVATAQSLETEAKTFVDKYMRTVIVDVGDGTSLSYTYRKTPMYPAWFKNYWQYQAAGWSLEEDSLSADDQLNGVTWKGWLHFHAAALRKNYESFDENSTTIFHPCWMAWQTVPNLARWYVEKKDGKWGIFERYPVGFPRDQWGPGTTTPQKDDIVRILSTPKCSAARDEDDKE
jgi:hypothetical protein